MAELLVKWAEGDVRAANATLHAPATMKKE